MATEGPVQNIASMTKGQDRRNAVTIHTIKQKEKSMWILQNSCTSAYESTVFYAPVDISSMQSAMTGCDSSNIAILPSGFSILPDGLESRPLVISSRQEDKNVDGGSLLTIAFQIVAGNIMANLHAEANMQQQHIGNAMTTMQPAINTLALTYPTNTMTNMYPGTVVAIFLPSNLITSTVQPVENCLLHNGQNSKASTSRNKLLS